MALWSTHTWHRAAVVMQAVVLVIALTLPSTASAYLFEEGLQPSGAPVNTGAPQISGTPAVGQTLTCSAGAWSGSPDVLTYTWLRDGAAIAGQNSSSYVVQSVDVGHLLSCRVSAVNSGGSYTLSDLTAGSYKVSFETGTEIATGSFLPQYYNGQASSSSANAVSITPGSIATGINASLAPAGAIAGRETAMAGGAPLPGMRVCAFSRSIENCATTNSAGDYTIRGLPAGSYVVMFFGEDEEGLNYGSEYYGGKVHIEGSPAVTVAVGSTTAGIDAQMVAGGIITGLLRGLETHRPVAEVFVCALDEDGSEFGECAETNSRGEYSISGLSAGSYELEFSDFSCTESGCRRTDYLEATAANVVVAAGAVTTHNEELATAGRITGEVKSAVGARGPIADVDVCVTPAGGGLVDCVLTESDGRYTLEGLAGEYRVTFSGRSCPGAGCAQQNLTYQEYEGGIVRVIAGGERALNLVSMRIGGTIRGTLTDAASHIPLAGSEVCDTGPAYDCAETNARGEYTLVGLPSGTYEVTFVPDGNYSRLKIGGIRVTEGSPSAGVDGAVQPAGQITGRIVSGTTGAGIGGIDVCAIGPMERCVASAGPSSAATAISGSVTVPQEITLEKLTFDPKQEDLDFLFVLTTPGRLSWSLFFKNADVAFADSLGVSSGADRALAYIARHRHKAKRPKRCSAGEVRRHARCKHLLVPFASGSESVSVGTVEVRVHADTKAVKALRAGHTLHVSGKLTFQAAAGGEAVILGKSTTLRPPPRRHRRSRKHRRH